MGAYDVGGGGGPIGAAVDENDRYGLSKPHDLAGDMDASALAKIDEMFGILFRALQRGEDTQRDHTTDLASLADDVSGLSGGNSDLLVASVTLTDAQIKALGTTPIQLVAAPGADKAIVVLNFFAEFDVTGGQYDVGPTFRLRLSGLTVNAASAWTPSTSSNAVYYHQSSAAAASYQTNDPRNRALMVTSSTDLSLGNAANYLTITVAYFLATTE